MQSYLPKTQKGFTLVELLVVISIIAILSAIGITIFTGSQKSARDGVRRGDIDAIAKALESNKIPASTTYSAMSNSWFSKGVVPTSPLPGAYCYKTSSTAVPLTSALTWTSGACTGTTFGVTIDDGAATNAKFWKVCAQLEETTTNTATPPVTSNVVYCQSSTQ